MVDLAAVAAGGAGSVDAALLVGTVLLEAVLLYIGYGAVERVVGNRVVERLRGE
ncbi:DUF7512 family protein [Haloarcula sediminis]|uniref:DUF7512 family protein n=1 Tax=Haloarcula sediminis TaxID=3111777 RepID=UPI002D79A60F|nr:hypothetical protein [Haloarcula sp. CK38]